MVFFSYGAVAPINYMGCWVFVDISNQFSNCYVFTYFATDQNGELQTLTGLLASGPLVLFFYPKAMTPG